MTVDRRPGDARLRPRLYKCACGRTTDAPVCLDCAVAVDTKGRDDA